MKKLIIWIVIIAVVLGAYFLIKKPASVVVPVETPPVTDVTPPVVEEDKTQTVIGKSVEGRDITAYHFGTGDTQVLFVGGIHGGYEWNTSLVAYELMDYLKANPTVIPSNVKVTVIPVLNPDGLNKVVSATGKFAAADVATSKDIQISGRFNGNTVDLNRNFDCDWQSSGKWQTTTVSGGMSAFSEPESLAIKNYIETLKPSAVVVWYSAAGGVFASSCHDGVLPETTALTSLYAKASGYKAYESFNFYEITGDMVNWLAKIKIPAISVLLTNHTDTEWSKNQKGIDALLQSFTK
ncbi:MAG: M14 family zinc carboxypeptidase [bacterium]|nr:M14 family zinc carboxypeptidase [bacterium]